MHTNLSKVFSQHLYCIITLLNKTVLQEYHQYIWKFSSLLDEIMTKITSYFTVVAKITSFEALEKHCRYNKIELLTKNVLQLHKNCISVFNLMNFLNIFGENHFFLSPRAVSMWSIKCARFAHLVEINIGIHSARKKSATLFLPLTLINADQFS